MSVAAPASPFKGLASFEDADRDAMLFFGRERERAVVTANLMGARITVLYGATGVGKSSLLRAGVAHGLRSIRDALVVVHDTWSSDPVRDLGDALGSDASSLADAAAEAAERVGGHVYLILDQFEEFFLYHDAEPFATEIAGLVADNSLRANVLIGVRDDALARLDELKVAVPKLLANRLRLDHLDRDAGEAAIVGPIAAYNRLVEPEAQVEIEPRLVKVILDQVTVGRVGRSANGAEADIGQPGAIEAPYLQLVLERLWETELTRGSRQLRAETLHELGGASHIVEQHLERAMAGLSPGQQDAAAAMYDHLVTPSGTKIALRTSDLARYAALDEPAAREVLDRLARERILRGARVNGAATRYEIYHDVLGDAVLSWRERHEASRALREEERRRKRAHRIAAAAVAALVVVAALAIFALIERSNAKQETRHARAGRLVAEARGDLEADPLRSIALALAATRGERTAQAESVLRDALMQSRVRLVVRAPSPVITPAHGFFVVGDARGRLRTIGDGGAMTSEVNVGAPIRSVAAFGAASVAAGTEDGTIVIRHRGAAERRRRVAGAVTAVAIAGSRLAAGTGTGDVSLWNGERRHHVHVRGRVSSIAFSPDRRLALVTSRDRRARLVDARSGRIAHTLTQRGYINAAAFDPRGRIVVTGSQDGTGRLWDARTGRALHDLGPAAGLGVTAVAFSPDGTLVGVASADGVARVYEARTGVFRFYLSGDTSAITDLAFNPAGSAIVTASADRTARIWKSDVGRQLVVLRGHRDAVTQAFFTSDGRRVVTAGADGTVRMWDPGIEPELRVLVREPVRFVGAVREANGDIGITDARGRTTVLDAGARRVLRVLRGAPLHRAPAVATHGDLVARAASDRSVTVARHGRTIDRFSARADSLAFSPDGRLLAIGGSDGYLSIRDVASKRLLYRVIAHQGPVEAVSFSPDGRWVVTGGPISAGVWDGATGSSLLLLHGPERPLQAALFTRDGRRIVTAGNDGTIRTYDCVVCGTLEQLRHAGQARLAQAQPP